MEFKDQVRYARKKLVLSQQEFAGKLGVTFATINRWERGHCRPHYLVMRAFLDLCKENGIEFPEE